LAVICIKNNNSKVGDRRNGQNRYAQKKTIGNGKQKNGTVTRKKWSATEKEIFSLSSVWLSSV